MRIVLLLLFSGTTGFCQIEPTAGKWKTWVVKDIAMYKLPPPPDKQRSIDELAEIRTLQGTDSAGMRDKVLYWNAGSPGYRWNNMITALSRPGVPPFREMALLNVAIYDATVVAWDAKYRFSRSRPGMEIRKYIEVPQSPSYPCEHAVTAGAASVVMAYLFPDKADSFRLLADELCRSRIASGVQYPSDVSQGYALDVITPPFPGYPSGHATTSSAVATVMGYLFPAESEKFRQLARECAESRFEGGIHFRTDNEVGLEMGEKIGRLIISRIKNDGAGR